MDVLVGQKKIFVFLLNPRFIEEQIFKSSENFSNKKPL